MKSGKTVHKPVELGRTFSNSVAMLRAFYFLQKPFGLQDLCAIVQAASCNDEDADAKVYQIKSTKKGSLNIVGTSLAVQNLRNDILDVAYFDKTDVLVMGPNGSGKELVAQAIHAQNPRKDRPIIAINCGAMTSTLIESTLFGFKKGSFSDAKEDRKGKFEDADGGTLFLDEIGEMPCELQTALLRVLETKEVVPIGASKPIPVDVRVIAATNKNLYEEVEKGRFREDLLYRLERLVLFVPSLNQRAEDIPLLVEHIKEEFYRIYQNIVVKDFDDEAIRVLQNFNWRGNIRQLQNVIFKALIFNRNKQIIVAEDIKKHLSTVYGQQQMALVTAF